jgi:hypothetical protein
MAARVRDGPHSRGRVAVMDDQRVPNSEEMDEQEAIQFLTELVSNLSAERLYEIIHEDYTLEMPQSAYANPPSIQVRRVLVRDGLWTFEGSMTTAGIRYTTSRSSSSLKTARCSGTRATTPSRSRDRSGGRSGSSGWNPKQWAQPNFG